MGFFDDHVRFLETSQTSAIRNRLNKRHSAIFELGVGALEGKRVLDIASHDGRWTFAALKAGAAHVTGVEPRRHLIRNANETLLAYGCAPASFTFVEDDVFRYLERTGERFDVVFCLGFFYHTYRHPDLLRLIRKCEPETLVIDTQVHPGQGPLLWVSLDSADLESDAVPEPSTYNGKTFVGRPTVDLLTQMVEYFGFTHRQISWPSLIATDQNIEGIEDYRVGNRVTLVCSLPRA